MSRLDDLPPDQQAALSLLLRRRQSYADLAAVLNISERAVHDRAHAGLAMLAPAQARELSAQERERIGDFLLGQQRSDDERAGTLLVLASSAEARAWAQALVAELAPIGEGALPQIPTDDATAAPANALSAPAQAAPALAHAPPAPETSTRRAAPAEVAATERAGGRPQLPVSRTTGAILLAALVVGVVLAVLLIPSGGSSPKSAGASKAPASRGEAAS